MTLTADPNGTGASRSATVTIAGQSVTVVQSGDAVANGGFSDTSNNWQTYGAPSSAYMDSRVNGGVFEWRRLAQPVGQPVSQGRVFQRLPVIVANGAGVSARFRLGNTSGARKYVKVLLVGDSAFSDLAVCTFWLGP